MEVALRQLTCHGKCNEQSINKFNKLSALRWPNKYFGQKCFSLQVIVVNFLKYLNYVGLLTGLDLFRAVDDSHCTRS